MKVNKEYKIDVQFSNFDSTAVATNKINISFKMQFLPAETKEKMTGN